MLPRAAADDSAVASAATRVAASLREQQQQQQQQLEQQQSQQAPQSAAAAEQPAASAQAQQLHAAAKSAAAAAAAAVAEAGGSPHQHTARPALTPEKKRAAGTKRPAERHDEAARGDGAPEQPHAKRLEVPTSEREAASRSVGGSSAAATAAAVDAKLGGGPAAPPSNAALAAAAPLKAAGPAIAGERWLALPLLCTQSRKVEANLRPEAAVRAFVRAARPFLKRRIDDTKCKLLLVLPRDSSEARALDALDEPLGEQVRVLRVADRAAVASALVHLHSEHALGCRFLANEATWRLRGTGAPLNRAIFNAAGENYAAQLHDAHPLPAAVGDVVPSDIAPVAPLRRAEGVHCVLHVVAPVVDPDAIDREPLDSAEQKLEHAYTALFEQFEARLV